MKKITLLTLLCCAVLSFGCKTKISIDERSEDVYSEKFTATNLSDIATKVKTDKNVPTEDIVMLTNALKRLSVSKDSIIGKTVKQLIENELRYVRDYSSEQYTEVSKICMLRINTESKFLGVLPGKDKDGKEINNLYFQFKNNMKKSIKALAGEMQFYYRADSLSDPMPIKPIKFNFEKTIAGNSVDTLIFYQPYSPNDEISTILRSQTAKISGVLNVFQVKE